MLYMPARLSEGGSGEKKKKPNPLETLKSDSNYSQPKPSASEKLALGMGPINDATYRQATQTPQQMLKQALQGYNIPSLGVTGQTGATPRAATSGAPSFTRAGVDAARTQTTQSPQTTQTAPSRPAHTTQSQSGAPAPTGQTVESIGATVGTSLGANYGPSPWTGQGIEALIAENNDLISRMTETGNAQIAQLNSFYAGLLSQIENMRRDLIARSERDQQELDPATMHTLELLRESAQENLRRVKEEANRRGILDSGIALGMEQESDKAFQQAEAGILSDRLSRLKEQLDAQLMRLQEMAFGIQRDQGQTLFEAQRDLENRLMQARQYGDTRLESALDRQMRTRDQMLREALATADITGRFISPDAQALVNQILEAKERNRTGQDPTAAAQADLARRRLEAMGYDTSGLGADVPLEQAYRNASNIGLRMPQPTAPAPAQPNLNTATRNALVIAQQYTNRDEALADLQAQLPNFLASGVDLEVLMDYINRLPSRGNPTMGEALRALRGH